MNTHQRIPDYLKQYVVDQDYARYTPVEQATWRFIMRQLRHFLTPFAHPKYIEGLETTGISHRCIPKVEDIDKSLQEFGWGAVCVRGFIPPAAFLEFQACRILPIAADMRTMNHADYTSAPDIVHEAAGHAPIIADPGYAKYLTEYARLAQKAIFSDEDVRLYEAIRVLSDVKENPDASTEDIAEAESVLVKASQAVTYVSEAAKVARMSWWTIEYGLVEHEGEAKIYGAGLLSSVSEGCNIENVPKVALGLNSVAQGYDITEPQPQLFFAKSFAHMSEVLSELENTMAFRLGGLAAVEVAKRAGTVTTVELDSGVCISGILQESKADGANLRFLKWSGPVQLSYDGQEIENQGKERHPGGFSSPIGSCGELAVVNWSEEDFLACRAKGELVFDDGTKITGELLERQIREGKTVLLTWDNCTVTQGDSTLYEPEWGVFDQVIGASVKSAFGGPADWSRFGDYDVGRTTSQPGRTTPFTRDEQAAFALYDQVRNWRESKNFDPVELQEFAQTVFREYTGQWLLALEILELMALKNLSSEVGYWKDRFGETHFQGAHISESLKKMIDDGISILDLEDETLLQRH